MQENLWPGEGGSLKQQKEPKMSLISSQHHSFDLLLAKRYGVEEAILIHHFQHWIRLNRAHDRNIKEGSCWTYQTRKDIQSRFPYWKVEEVRRLCERLVKLGVLKTGNYNKLRMDKTLWYAFVDEKAFAVDEETSKFLYERQFCQSSGESANRDGNFAKAIPDTKTTDPLPSYPKKATTSPTPSKGSAAVLSIEEQLRKSKLSKEQAEEAIVYYQQNKEKVLEKDNPTGYVITMVMLNKRKQGFRKQEIIEKRIKAAQKMEFNDGTRALVALREGIELIRGAVIKFVRYDESSTLWDDNGLGFAS